MTIDEQIEQAVCEVTKRAYAQAVLLHGREPTCLEVAVIQFQAQLSMLASSIFEDEAQLEYWNNVITVIQGGKANGTA